MLFFSLNKAATTDILKNLQKEVKELKEESEENEYFHILVMKMLDSEEYGIKDSDLGYWTRVCVEYIARADRLNGRSSKRDVTISDNKGFMLIQQYFLSEDREGRVEAAREVLHDLFDQYFQSIQQGEYDVQEGRCLENVLYFISSPPILDNSFQEKIEEAVPVLLNRERYGLQFLAAMELFVEPFNEIADSVAAVYTIDEAILCKDILGKSITRRLAREDDRKHWLDVLLRRAMFLENLSVFSLLKVLFRLDGINEKTLRTSHFSATSEQWTDLRKSISLFWKTHWYSLVWFRHSFGLYSTNKKYETRSRVISSFHNSNNIETYPLIEGETCRNIQKTIKKVGSNLDRQEKSLWWWRILAILSSTNAFLYSDIEHDQDGNRYDYLWTTYEELQHIYTLLQNPEALYAHLNKISTSIIDKPTFLEQYKEYDQKPYSMRHMAKTVLDRGKENYPDSDNDKMLKKCQELVERVARQVEAEKNAEAREKL
ncbi:MAG: hypothetical protein D3909_08740 [Candidatus Electrothrix sp. ATG1]|nr:hypothetical protein [Candidatus Electrothrix sp. ATG1]